MKSDIEKVSRLFMWGFEGPTVTTKLKTFLKKYPPSGVILFKRNIESAAQISHLTSDLKKINGPLLIGIDEEGGRVRRLPQFLMNFPPAVTWGRIYEKEGDLAFVQKAAFYLARELRRLGINLDFAPILDVHSNPKNPIIGDRAFSSNPHTAGKVACAFYEGLQKGGVIACGKHFPGHGDTTTDSHLTLPVVTRSLASLKKIEFPPFAMAIRKKIPLLMTAHVVYTALDRKNPATLSSKILQDLLRKKMGYQGVVVSDDLQMKAVSKKYTEAESAILTLEAGSDLLLICQGAEEGDSTIEKVAREIRRHPSLQKRAEESLRRLKNLQKKVL